MIKIIRLNLEYITTNSFQLDDYFGILLKFATTFHFGFAMTYVQGIAKCFMISRGGN